MDLKLVEYLLLACECGSFSKAAAKIGIGQPALGRQIEKLEKECGVRLLYRHGRGVSLTPEGQRFVSGVRPLIQQIDTLSASLQTEHSTPHGTVVAGLSASMLNLIGPKLVDRIHQKHPGITLNVISGGSGAIHDALVDGTLDIALLHEARRSKHIAVDFLLAAGLHLVSAAGSSRADQKNSGPVGLKELASIPLVLPSSQHGLRLVLDRACAAAGITLNVRYEMDTLSLLKHLVHNGEVDTILIIPAVLPELEERTVFIRPLAPRLEIEVMIAAAFKRAQTQAMRVTCEEIVDIARQTIPVHPIDLDIRLS